MIKNNIKAFNFLNKLHDQEKKFKKELAKTFLEYLDNLPPNKRIEQMESLLSETQNRNHAGDINCLPIGHFSRH